MDVIALGAQHETHKPHTHTQITHLQLVFHNRCGKYNIDFITLGVKHKTHKPHTHSYYITAVGVSQQVWEIQYGFHHTWCKTQNTNHTHTLILHTAVGVSHQVWGNTIWISAHVVQNTQHTNHTHTHTHITKLHVYTVTV